MSLPETIEAAGGEIRWIERPGGVRLRAASFGLPGRDGADRGWCAVLTGYTEFIEKTLETVVDLRSRGFAVLVHDWRGQGLSDRLLHDRHKGHLDHFATHRDDLFAIWRAYGIGLAAEGPAPVVLAHSMGGHVALLAERHQPGTLGPTVLLAPMLGIIPHGFPNGVAKAVAELICGLGFSDTYIFAGAGYHPQRRPFESNRLTRDRARFERFHRLIAANRDLAIGDPTFGWVRAAFHSLAETEAPGWFEAIETPVLMVSAGDEGIVDNSAIFGALSRLPMAEGLHLEGARHDVLNETDAIRATLWRAIDDFLARHDR